MGVSVGRARDTTCRTLLYAPHDAFRRDLDRLAAAVAAGKGGAAHVRAGWDNLKDQLRMHHDLEDRVLWPRVERAVAGRPAELAVLAEMRAEHARIGPPSARVDAALAGPGGAAPAKAQAAVAAAGGAAVAAVAALRDVLEAHLRHEEATALPLAESVLDAAQWRELAAEAERRCEAGAPLFVPWVVDGIAPVARSRFLTSLPGPVRERNRVMWEPRYRKRRLWST
ncbi:hemerythrin domain-containing protein [Actinomadura bangladeshensis]|uniref:Hemerythrin domain-containing protein n=1 Tax=Actinomadura bangladeshensis TaxID=453573 RepID=A0A4R4P407_9ACTN|nr:hemerythrin domain-containing protein [Actinomadura bangladeshensis]TDC16755.1 hemerythrin domain-containing protein [Actinomadura bangladeshensis]